MRRLKNALCAMLFCAPLLSALGACVHLPPVADMSGGVTASPAVTHATAPFLFDNNRVFVEIAFRKPDGSLRKALAFVNMGAGGFQLSNALFRELAPHPGAAQHVLFGDMDIAVDGAAFQPESLANAMVINFSPSAITPEKAAQGAGGLMADMAAPLKVEAILPPGLLQHFVFVTDYGARTLTLAVPGVLKPEGIAVPIRVNPQTGFAMLDATIDGARHVFVIDNGGSYSGIRDVAPWIDKHPGWLRSIGGIGEANLVMAPGAVEAIAPVVKVPDAAFGDLRPGAFGLIQMGGVGMMGGLESAVFWDHIYSPKAGETVDGMLAGNVLRSFRLTIDYPNHMSYWQQQSPLDTHDLDQVGVVLVHWKGETTVIGIAQKNGAPALTTVAVGDKILAIDGAATAAMTRGQLLDALHGTPGDIRHLTLERDGKRLEVDAPVTGF